jgi:hypothetical protein
VCASAEASERIRATCAPSSRSAQVLAGVAVESADANTVTSLAHNDIARWVSSSVTWRTTVATLLRQNNPAAGSFSTMGKRVGQTPLTFLPSGLIALVRADTELHNSMTTPFIQTRGARDGYVPRVPRTQLPIGLSDEISGSHARPSARDLLRAAVTHGAVGRRDFRARR